MLKVQNVSKSYVSQSKQKVDALRGVDFELGNTGMVFILGKSGSGKSTLLNLLGGLDSPSGGQITVDGVSMKDFKQADYDSYRNGYVGFVFQEYNLLDEFNVRDNIAIALQLSKGDNVNSKVVDALQQVELSEDYASRRVGELSGGEKQRVAIARCIVKDSKLILADEPTGNLDSATGESIWNILKKLSQTKLVVVVSHDRENADKYGDRILEIADGKLIADSGLQQTNEGVEKENGYTLQKKRLAFAVCLKMGVNSMFRRKFRTACVVLVSILSVVALLITQMMLCFSSEETLAKFIKDNNVSAIIVSRSYPKNSSVWGNTYIRQDAKDYIGNNTKSILCGRGEIGYVDGKQQILDFGLNFIGEVYEDELSINSYYISTYCLENYFYRGGNYVVVDGEKEFLVKEKHPIESLIGKKVFIDNLMSKKDEVPTLAGVVDTGSIDETLRIVPRIFARRGFESAGHIGKSVLNSPYEFDIKFGEQVYSGILSLRSELGTDYDFWDGELNGFVLMEDGTKIGIRDLANTYPADDEIVLSYEAYVAIFNDALSKGYYVNSDDAIPPQVGQRLSFRVYDCETGSLLYDFGECKLVGVRFDTDEYISSGHYEKNLYVHISPNQYKSFGVDLDDYSVLINTASVKNLAKFLTTLRKDYDLSINMNTLRYITYMPNGTGENSVATLVYDFEEALTGFLPVFGVVAAILTAIMVLLVINLISFSITNRKKEIGILSALGTSNRDIVKIFILETLIIAVVCFVVSIVAAGVLAYEFNVAYGEYLPNVIPFMRVDVFTILTLAVASFGMMLLAALIPIRRIAKLKPIDAIRNS